MTLRLREADGADRADWTAFVASRPEGDVLQSWAWGEAGAGETGRGCSRLIVVDANGRTRGLAQVFERRSTFGQLDLEVPHGPLWDRDDADAAEVLARLLTGLKAHGTSRRATVLQLDPRASGDAAADAALTRALQATARAVAGDEHEQVSQLIELAVGEDPLAGWPEEARLLAGGAERAGITVHVDRAGDPAALDAFASLLSVAATQAHPGVPERAALGRLAEALAPSGDWFLALAVSDGRTLAGAATPRTGDRACRLYAASLGEEGAARCGRSLRRHGGAPAQPARGGHDQARCLGHTWSSGPRRCAIPAASRSSSIPPATASADVRQRLRSLLR